MRLELDRWLSRAWHRPSKDARLLVYGAGSAGRAVRTFLADAGYRVDGFLDRNAGVIRDCEGLPVHTPDEWVRGNDPRASEVIVAIHNFAVDVAPLVDDLRMAGFARVMNIVDYANAFPEDRTDRYWLAPAAHYAGHRRDIERLFEIVTEPTSVDWLERVLEFRMTGDYGRLPAPGLDDAYFPSDLPRWRDPVRFIDCGAFIGDSIDALARRGGYSIEALAAFEPDPVNFAKLARNARQWGPTACRQCAVGRHDGTIRFDDGHGAGSRTSEAGATIVQCVSIDRALEGFRPTLIKMDIEGAEIDALEGARGTIESSRSALAISLYHRPDHLWEIPLLVHRWDIGYQLFVRGHAHGSYDLVLYAVPRGGPATPSRASGASHVQKDRRDDPLLQRGRGHS